ncbi:MAG: 1-deoxy-D-xylulose-5-phosphate reductoisomerase [Oscillospiraceae bacterium]|nr:1-deoxy-D-xylulose-5-phosphate reductoisomerase [Oscillospiraceae bacterium]
MKKVAIIGSTGSIGTQAVSICLEKGIPVTALATGNNISMLAKQAKILSVKKVCIYNTELKADLEALLSGTNIEVLSGEEGLLSVAADGEHDILLNSVVGMVGLKPTLAAIEAGKDIALANKETLVAGGKLVMTAAEEKGVKILPVDSEHSAIFQCLEGRKKEDVNKIILTASGGPFFGKTFEELENVTVENALNHPNWSMGNKITIDSATLMNKGLEVIEAAWLFNMDVSKIDIVVHRESIVHSMIELSDHAVIAELGVPDMRIPIQLALTYPDRENCSVKPLSFSDYPSLTFYKPDRESFPCLDICINAMKKGGLYPALVNGANEEAVASFLSGKCKFTDIPKLITAAAESLNVNIPYTLDNIYYITEEAKRFVRENL